MLGKISSYQCLNWALLPCDLTPPFMAWSHCTGFERTPLMFWRLHHPTPPSSLEVPARKRNTQNNNSVGNNVLNCRHLGNSSSTRIYFPDNVKQMQEGQWDRNSRKFGSYLLFWKVDFFWLLFEGKFFEYLFPCLVYLFWHLGKLLLSVLLFANDDSPCS